MCCSSFRIVLLRVVVVWIVRSWKAWVLRSSYRVPRTVCGSMGCGFSGPWVISSRMFFASIIMAAIRIVWSFRIVRSLRIICWVFGRISWVRCIIWAVRSIRVLGSVVMMDAVMDVWPSRSSGGRCGSRSWRRRFDWTVVWDLCPFPVIFFWT